MNDIPEAPAAAAASIYQRNITHAHVTGKVPQARQNSHGRGRNTAKTPAERKSHAKKLKKRGLISDSVAARLGL